MPKIAVTTTSFAKDDGRPLKLLQESGFEVVMNQRGARLKDNQVVELCRGAVGIIAGTENLNKDIFAKLPRLKAISRCGSGLDNIDLAAAESMGIKVFNTPAAPTVAVAELTIGLILSLLRKIPAMDKDLKNGEWQRQSGDLLFGKKVGIVGLGRIGKKVAQLLSQFNCDIAYTDIFSDTDIPGLRCFSLEDLLVWSQIILIHASGKNMILGKRQLGLMQRGAWLVNVSRGDLVDEETLYKMLKNGHLAGAAIDVFNQEPYRGPLKDLENVILTPHIGSYTKETRAKMEIEATENLIKGLKEVFK